MYVQLYFCLALVVLLCRRPESIMHTFFDTFHVLIGTKSSYIGTCCFSPLCTIPHSSYLTQIMLISFIIIYLFLHCCMWFPNSFVSALCSHGSVDIKRFAIQSMLAASLHWEIWLFKKNTLVMKLFYYIKEFSIGQNDFELQKILFGKLT